MKKSPRLGFLAIFCTAFLLQIPAAGTVIYQGGNPQHVIWEAEDTYKVENSAPGTWTVRSDAPASGQAALYHSGDNSTDLPSSYATYAIQFTVPGTYTLYVRWRADSARTSQDPNGANSYRIPASFGTLPKELANFLVSSANNSRTPPAVNNYGVTRETATTYTVSQADIDAGAPLYLQIGTREWGMYIDRFVLSQNDAMTEPEVNALGNSETSVVQQNTGDSFIAFEAERISFLDNNSPGTWQVKADAPASSGIALYHAGDNSTDLPSSYALYNLRFSTPGIYHLYVRWRADSARTSQDPNGANSYRIPAAFGDLAKDLSNFLVSAANNSRTPPAVNNYGLTRETAASYEVTQDQINSGVPLVLKIGTREWGMYIDRIVLSQSDALTEPEFNALANSGAGSRPVLLSAVGSASLTSVRVSFDRALKAESVSADRFTIPGLNVAAAELDLATAKDVLLTTSSQTQGSRYEVNVTGVTDVNNNPVAAGSKAAFTAWRLTPGWVLHEVYNGAGTTVGELQALPSFPAAPDTVGYTRSVSLIRDQVNDFGSRLTTYFIPPATDEYEFFIYGDDEAFLQLGSDDTEATLADVLQTIPGYTTFSSDVAYTSGTLAQGQRYLLRVLYKQSSGDARVAVGVRRAGSNGDPSALAPLSGPLIATYTNPDAGAITIAQHPADAMASAGSRARFSVNAATPSGGELFFQWQRNRENIPGAVRQTYVTPVLTMADANAKYRVIVSVNGTEVASNEATLSVTTGEPSNLVPYLGINFVGGGNNSPGAALTPEDVAGVVPQSNFNNIAGSPIQQAALHDAAGASTPVTVTVDPVNNIGLGSGESSADHAMFQGYVHGNNTPITLTLENVPAGSYHLVVYSLGFNFNSTYEQDVALTGGGTYPTYTVKADDVRAWLQNPAFRRMQSTNPNARDSGNYIMFENVAPAGDGTLILALTPQSSNTGVTYLPPINAVQLVKVQQSSTPPMLSATRQAQDANLRISWGALAAGFRLESSSSLAAGANWNADTGAPNPIAGAGFFNVPLAGSGRFFRLAK